MKMRFEVTTLGHWIGDWESVDGRHVDGDPVTRVYRSLSDVPERDRGQFRVMQREGMTCTSCGSTVYTITTT